MYTRPRIYTHNTVCIHTSGVDRKVKKNREKKERQREERSREERKRRRERERGEMKEKAYRREADELMEMKRSRCRMFRDVCSRCMQQQMLDSR